MSDAGFRNGDVSTLRATLEGTLSLASDEAFFLMLWAVNALQTGRVDHAKQFIGGFPEKAVTEGIAGDAAIYPWELETLANEFLTCRINPVIKMFDCRRWDEIAYLINVLRSLEDEEAKRSSEGNYFLSRELGKIAARQFDWQRGFFNIPELYRSSYIYDQGECGEYFNASVGITLSDFSFVGFSLMAVFLQHPAMRPADNLDLLHELGVPPEAVSNAINRVAAPIGQIRKDATGLREKTEKTAYKPSILRRFPCLRLGARGQLLVAPLPELVAHRFSSGIFYDVIGGGGPVRSEVGERFETYSIRILSSMLAPSKFEREWRYKGPRGKVDTPDIVMSADDGSVSLAIECKAARMDVAARFGDEPDSARGYDEIVNGVVQLWRFFAHCRLGRTGRDAQAEACGLVLTLDEWFIGRTLIPDTILERATSLVSTKAPEVAVEDRRPIAFCSISDLETVLVRATTASFHAAVKMAAGEKRGWLLPSLHGELDEPKTDPKPYPFINDMADLLPWYARLSDMFRGSEDAC